MIRAFLWCGEWCVARSKEVPLRELIAVPVDADKFAAAKLFATEGAPASSAPGTTRARAERRRLGCCSATMPVSWRGCCRNYPIFNS
jgi:hypothetical protein